MRDDNDRKKYYTNRILELSKTFDDNIKKFRDQNNRTKRSNWILVLILKPITQLSNIKNIQNQFTNLLSRSLSIPLIVSFLPILLPNTEYLEIIQSKYWVIISFIVGYLVTLRVNYLDMIELESESFHIDAYAFAKKTEFRLFNEAFSHDITFEEIFHYMHESLSTREVIDERLSETMRNVFKEIQLQFNIEKEKYIFSAEQIEEIVEEQELVITKLRDRRNYYAQFSRLLQLFIEEVSSIFDRIEDGTINLSHFKIFPFTIYEVGKKSIVGKRIINQGTYINDENIFKNMKVTTHTTQEINYSDDLRIVVIRNGDWIVNFHLELKKSNATTRLITEYGIISEKMFFSLINNIFMLIVDKLSGGVEGVRKIRS
ncbi:hypothetical protein [Chengkuizengella axinellae]|uniref:Uncharacterized protein n=1 Tax=Chengkuizengella axinellae TaxID=3064388 RepID=A0ABT9J5I0_9BACL|nr:hypothetical protein [Chengkuizengella sp. 2205SS18-9]MDP5276209.1 hypothetical protein [Chengkuizengella sp. 2205SS18-9]